MLWCLMKPSRENSGEGHMLLWIHGYFFGLMACIINDVKKCLVKPSIGEKHIIATDSYSMARGHCVIMMS